MPLTKAQARTAVRDAIDDPDAKRWSDSALDALIGRTIDGLWSDVLDFAPWILTQFQEPTVTTPGFIDLRLASQGGQLTQRFYRLQKLTRGGREYNEARQSDVLIENDTAIVAPDSHFSFYGSQLYVFPLSVTNDIEIRYNFLPTAFVNLTNGTNVPWPEGYDDAYIYGAARRAFAKGDTESIAQATDLSFEAMKKLEAAIRKQRIGPQVPTAYDSPIQYGGI